jgi:glycosyltransferase involved in cell wall biosynthesis
LPEQLKTLRQARVVERTGKGKPRHEDTERLRLQAEADAAINLSRILRQQLRQLQPDRGPDTPPAIETKQRIHSWLDVLQTLTPGFIRTMVRPVYLNLIYYRLFPEYSKARQPEKLPVGNGFAAWSGYAPFLAFKQRLCRTLNQQYNGFTTPCRPGLVSIVLPVYNGASFIAASIDSVLAQTYTDFELIVVDDGSTDETPSILESYRGDARVRVIRQPNRKLPAALNAGFAEACGEFGTWTSADNLMHPGMLAELSQFLNGNPDAEMVYADYDLIDAQGLPALDTCFCREYQTPDGSSVLHLPYDPGELSFVQNNYIGGCFLYRTWAARAVGDYSQDCFGFEDYDFWLRMNALFRVAHLGRREGLYSYRLHSESLTAREKELQVAERARYYLPLEEERRRFFAASFDITLAGSHPWFRILAHAYRRAGHNVMEIADLSSEALYRYRVTRAFSKSILITTDPNLAPHPQPDCTFLFQGNRLRAAGHDWRAGDPAQLEYPLLAVANSFLWRRQEGPKLT